ncbi:hypothetical protein HPC49_00985 [Pyxidicoccus fallax]|uniref:Uncharacterized protein n=1 Tax=Pyxidicoccus fallax TaxID=394095 RepID=A0A848L4P3_9BACT|nr:hypothetical protein [Pyxidicoccus fallax]NMO13684.1 hypothetical protein [Pyxidicoccus fallax]NPC76828.1 hypothetical protein [Pyxidicoccus fallax]
MTGETTIPMLPCVSMDETLDFYRALGFEMTYRQTRPNPYSVVRRGGFELHFYGLPGLNPASAHSSCLIVVPEVAPLHEALSEALRRTLGKLPVAGIPRITRMKPGQGRFTLVDLSGNSLIFVKRLEAGAKEEDDAPRAGSPLAKALAAAARLRDLKTDDAAAAKVLDAALARDEPSDPVERARALAARAELAVALGEVERARALRAELQALPLPDEVRADLRDELRAADDLERALGKQDFKA